jgi:hypothetical protein
VLVLLGLAAVLAYAMFFMPKAGTGAEGNRKAQTGTGSDTNTNTNSNTNSNSGSGSGTSPSSTPSAQAPAASPSSQETTSGQAEAPAGLAQGYVLRKDPAGFQIAVDRNWTRSAVNSRGQVRYSSGDFELVVVPGRDTVASYGSDPMAYIRESEPELQPFRDSTWSSIAGLRRIDVGQQAMAEAQFVWQDSSGRTVFVRNLALIVDGKYHIVMVIGPESQRDAVTAAYEQASTTYKPAK